MHIYIEHKYESRCVYAYMCDVYVYVHVYVYVYLYVYAHLCVHVHVHVHVYVCVVSSGTYRGSAMALHKLQGVFCKDHARHLSDLQPMEGRRSINSASSLRCFSP